MTQSLIVETNLPGVLVLVNQGQVARPIQRQPTSTFFAVGYSPWGPVNVPTTITSWADYVRQFGGFDANSFLDDAMYIFFNVFPGKTAVVVRVVGDTPVLGTLTLKDRSAAAGLNTLRVDAKYPSTRADIKVTVEDGAAANTIKLTVRSVLLARKEIHDNVTVADATTLTRVNQQSKIITLTNLNSVTAAPNNNPRALVETALAGGDDDFAGLAAADFIGTDDGVTRTGLQAFKNESFGGGQVAIPGLTTAPVHAALVAHGETWHRTSFIDPPLASDKDDVVAIRALYGTWHAALYWPWVEMLDFAGTGLRKFYPPSAFAAGECAKADRTIGTHKAPANLGSIPGALDVERTAGEAPQTDDNTREFLNSHDICVITPLPEHGVRIYGERVMTADRRISMVHQIRVLNLCYYSARKGYTWAVFAVVDGRGRLFRDLKETGVAFLSSLWASDALFGDDETDSYIVICDESNNPPEELENQRVHVQWGVKLSPTAEIVIINIDNVPLFQSLDVLQS